MRSLRIDAHAALPRDELNKRLVVRVLSVTPHLTAGLVKAKLPISCPVVL